MVMIKKEVLNDQHDENEKDQIAFNPKQWMDVGKSSLNNRHLVNISECIDTLEMPLQCHTIQPVS